MFNKEESKKIRQEFWTSFGKEYPRKWLLYNTKIKDLSLKFNFDRKAAEVSIDIETSDEIFRQYYFEKLQSLRAVLEEEFLPNVIFEKDYVLENRKIISRIYLRMEGVNIYRKDDWPVVKEWLYNKMNSLEAFFGEYRDFIDQ